MNSSPTMRRIYDLMSKAGEKHSRLYEEKGSTKRGHDFVPPMEAEKLPDPPKIERRLEVVKSR